MIGGKERSFDRPPEKRFKASDKPLETGHAKANFHT